MYSGHVVVVVKERISEGLSGFVLHFKITLFAYLCTLSLRFF